MSHVHLLAAWQHQDLEKIKELVHHDVKGTFVYPDGTESDGDYNKIISIFEERFQHVQQWQFDVVYLTERQSDIIVVIKISRETETGELVDNAGLGVFTFKNSDNVRQMTRVYMELGLTSEELR